MKPGIRRLLVTGLAAAAALGPSAGCRLGPAPSAPAARSAPESAPPLPPPDPSPPPVYREPRIGVVYLRAHEDAEGRLLGPQVMYQIIDSGGWDIDALDAGGSAVPPASVERPVSLGPPSAIVDPALAARAVITGLMAREDRPAAEALAAGRGAGWKAVFDREAGWLLVPGPGG